MTVGHNRFIDPMILHLRRQLAQRDARIAELECSAAEIDRLDMEMHEIDDDRAPVDVALDRITELEAVVDKLRSAAEKVILCFPDTIPGGQEEVSFDIPAYVIAELKEAAEAAKELP